ncbi:MAG: ribosome small subunit-dependent GTPase A [Rikenellaceae bacterium]
MSKTGTVIKSTGSWYLVNSDQGGDIVECRAKGRMRLNNSRSTNPIAVGDKVAYEMDVEEGVGVISDVLPRRNYLIRRASNLSKESHVIAANIDLLCPVVTLFSPPINFEFLDRMLVTAEVYHIPAVIVLNKSDLYDDKDAIATFTDIYNSAGYEVLPISCVTGEGLDELRELIHDKTTLFAGNSGVGKSSMVNLLEPELDVRTGHVSDSHNKGRHTTTFAQMYPLSSGGYIIDSPGVRGFGLVGVERDEICRYFPDLFRYAPECAYYNCIHTHEPDCAVKEAIARGYISESRYISYLKLLEEDGKYR